MNTTRKSNERTVNDWIIAANHEARAHAAHFGHGDNTAAIQARLNLNMANIDAGHTAYLHDYLPEVVGKLTDRDYYTLVIRDNRTGQWCIEFGDYDRAAVVDERSDCADSAWPDEFRSKIIKTADAQSAIEAAVRDLVIMR